MNRKSWVISQNPGGTKLDLYGMTLMWSESRSRGACTLENERKAKNWFAASRTSIGRLVQGKILTQFKMKSSGKQDEGELGGERCGDSKLNLASKETVQIGRAHV